MIPPLMVLVRPSPPPPRPPPAPPPAFAVFVGGPAITAWGLAGTTDTASTASILSVGRVKTSGNWIVVTLLGTLNSRVKAGNPASSARTRYAPGARSENLNLPSASDVDFATTCPSRSTVIATPVSGVKDASTTEPRTVTFD